MKEFDKMTISELGDELTKLGVKFTSKSRKAELIELLTAATESGPASAGEESTVDVAEVTPTPKAAAKKPAAKKPAAQKTSVKEVAAEAGVYAIIRTGGKQYQVATGDLLRVEKLAGAQGDSIELSDVLAVVEGEKITIGQPVVEGAKVVARIVEQGKAKKVLVFKKRRRQGYRVKNGHRQQFTGLQISEILS